LKDWGGVLGVEYWVIFIVPKTNNKNKRVCQNAITILIILQFDTLQ